MRKASGKRIYGIGHPMGVDATDSFISFLVFMDAYNVVLVDDNGKLLVDDLKVKQGLVNAMRDYTEPYVKSCTPPFNEMVLILVSEAVSITSTPPLGAAWIFGNCDKSV